MTCRFPVQQFPWRVTTYDKHSGELMMETVHADTHSRDMEIEAGLRIGRRVRVYDRLRGVLL